MAIAKKTLNQYTTTHQIWALINKIPWDSALKLKRTPI